MRKGPVFVIIGLLALGGCGEKSPQGPSNQKGLPVARPVQPGPSQSMAQPGPLSPKEKPAIFTPVEKSEPPAAPYNPTGKPDPFLPVQDDLDSKGRKKTNVLPLEQFQANEFELVGVVHGPGINKALVQDLTGKGFFIQVGTRIGKNGGKVVLVTNKEVVIEEPFQDFQGRKNVRKVSLKIP